MSRLLTKIFGDPNAKEIKRLQPLIDQINQLEGSFKDLSTDQLKTKTEDYKARLAGGEELDNLVPEAFALVREMSQRVLHQRQYNVQLVGGITLHRGMIAEMRTGEGKTLTATAPVYLNAITGKGVHVITVNDYLARRDAVWMGQVYHALGLTVAVIQHQGSFLYDPSFKSEPEHDPDRDATGSFRVDMDYLRPITRREAYHADITYGTNNEFGFDYLRDNMAPSKEHMVQRELHFAVIDEVDSILIDEARTPLIISAPAEEAAELYYRFSELVSRLQEETDYVIDEKMRTSTLTEAGIAKMEQWLGIPNLYERDGFRMVHHLEQALRAYALYKRDKDYVVKDNEVVIVDEFTGRMMEGRRYSEGLHQALEAKERVPIQRESITLATITFQNLFRLYKKLSGMTGTAATEAEEFSKIYELEVLSIPTHRPNQREDLPDRVYKSELGKFQAVVQEVKERHEKGQPILIGTASIEKNELLDELLTRAGIPHNMLNAKNHEREAEIIAQAGRCGSVTVATNMAGRGVDIILGGNPPGEEEIKAVRDLGGLFVLGTERHESRRIDNQLRGRAGRQGDPGVTQFYVSMDDDLMRIFSSERMKGMMETLKIPEDQPIENKMLTRSLEAAQTKVEGRNFDIRKHLLEYDDVLNKHRGVIYKKRQEILGRSEEPTHEGVRPLKMRVLETIEGEIEQIVAFHTADEDAENWDMKPIEDALKAMLPPSVDVAGKFKLATHALEGKYDLAERRTALIESIMGFVNLAYAELEEKTDDVAMAEIEKVVLLRTIDDLWVAHLQAMDYLRHGVRMQGYGQRDPLVIYKQEAYRMFHGMLAEINARVANTIFKVQVARAAAERDMHEAASHGAVVLSGAPKTSDELSGAEPGHATEAKGPGQAIPKVGRNESCPCGSGKKYKKCHGK